MNEVDKGLHDLLVKIEEISSRNLHKANVYKALANITEIVFKEKDPRDIWGELEFIVRELGELWET